MFFHAMNNAHVMFQFMTESVEEATKQCDAFAQHLLDTKIINKIASDVEIEINADLIENRFVLNYVWVWVTVDKMGELAAYAKTIPWKPAPWPAVAASVHDIGTTVARTPNGLNAIFGPDITFNTIDDIRNHQWVGNAASDMKGFNAIAAFVKRADVPLDEKYEAIDLMGINAMGLHPIAVEHPEMSKQEIVDEFLRDM